MNSSINSGVGSIWTLSALMAIGYLVAVLPPTAIDPRISHHVRFGARKYRWGWWIALGSLPVFVLTLVGMRLAGSAWRIAWSVIPLATASLPLIRYFKPEVPHGSVTTWIPAFIVLGLLAAWFRFGGRPPEDLLAQVRGLDARRELVKELLGHWRAVALALSGGYLALLISWFSFVWTLAPKITRDKGEQFILGMTAQLCLGAYSICVLLGPIRESWTKVDRIMDLFQQVGA